MKRALLGLLIASTAAAQPAPLTVQVDRLAVEDGRSKAVVRVVNSSNQLYRMVVVNCAFLRQNKALGTADAILTNVAAGQTAFETLALQQLGADQAQCRIAQARP